jgi:ABC-type molybdate transport system substrate-binding protein
MFNSNACRVLLLLLLLLLVCSGMDSSWCQVCGTETVCTCAAAAHQDCFQEEILQFEESNRAGKATKTLAPHQHAS